MIRTVQLSLEPEIKRLIRAALPDYKKRSAMVSFTDSVQIHNTWWDGGTRYSYIAIHINTLRSVPAPQYNPPELGGKQPRFRIAENIAIIQYGYFCGKPAMAHIYLKATEDKTKQITGDQDHEDTTN